MNADPLAQNQTHEALVWWALAVLLVLRLLSLACYPLTDNTEARYADIGRVMWALGDWVTPWIEAGVPFWGKPPLSFWLTAASLGALGVNEFAARLPHFLAALAVGWLTWRWALEHSRQQASSAVALLAGSSLMLLASGAVMTDMTLLLGILLAMRGFWLGLQPQADVRRHGGWLLLAGLALGLLAKGPLMLVLAGLPIGLWMLWQRNWGLVWRSLPWLRGGLLLLLLVVPWYALAEWRTPGFLDYFLIGEHWQRFVTPGWSGDRYGGAHRAPHGTIWLYAWVAALPWSLLLPLAAWRWRTGRVSAPVTTTEQPLRRYLLLWALAPALFFTLAGNILWTYVLPALPALALIGANWLTRRPNQRQVNQWLAAGLWLMSATLVALVAGLNLPAAQDWHSTRHLIAHYQAQSQTSAHVRPALIFYPERPYSAAFYSQGQAQRIDQAQALVKQLAQAPAYLAVKTSTRERLALPAQVKLSLQAEHGEFSLYLTHPPDSAKLEAAR